jgi:hypothetical protein
VRPFAGTGETPTAHATDTLQGCHPSATSLEAGRAVLQVPQHEGGVVAIFKGQGALARGVVVEMLKFRKSRSSGWLRFRSARSCRYLRVAREKIHAHVSEALLAHDTTQQAADILQAIQLAPPRGQAEQSCKSRSMMGVEIPNCKSHRLAQAFKCRNSSTDGCLLVECVVRICTRHGAGNVDEAHHSRSAPVPAGGLRLLKHSAWHCQCVARAETT